MFCFCRFLFKGCFNGDDNDEEYDSGDPRRINDTFGGVHLPDRFFWRNQNPFTLGGRIGHRVTHLRSNLYPTPDLLPPKYEDAIKIPTAEPPPVYSENGASELTLQPPPYENPITTFPQQIPTGTINCNTIRREFRIPQVSVTSSSQQFPSQFQIIYNNNTNRQLNINDERVRRNSTPETYDNTRGGAVMYLQYSGTENDDLPGSVNNDLERNKVSGEEDEIVSSTSNVERLSPNLIKQKSNSSDTINDRGNENVWKVRLPNSARYTRRGNSRTKNAEDNQPRQLNILTVCTLH
uniref:Uncharacterized protein n=1 Tax=Strongyloides venezuelensis TaxID=75913 RepID=A0A0K0FFT0_STRVS